MFKPSTCPDNRNRYKGHWGHGWIGAFVTRCGPTHSPIAHSADADDRFQQADRRFQAMSIILEERRSMGTLGVGVEG